ncbi:MAG: glyoxalase [Thermomicrobiales bacterium]|nr:MAG: glyoxalase [Thermomicrobiales bacterium]
MRITQSAISLNVPNVERSAGFLEEHFGFQRQMEADGFISLTRTDAGFNIIFLEVGLPSFKPATHAAAAGMGLLVVFVVEEIDTEWERLRGQDLTFPTTIQTEPWGERYFQVLDPGGIIYQLVQWV